MPIYGLRLKLKIHSLQLTIPSTMYFCKNQTDYR